MFGQDTTKRYRVSFPGKETEVLPEIQEDLFSMMREDTGIEVTADALPSDWKWTWVQNKGMITGKMTKRLASVMMQRFGHSVHPSHLQKWGEFIRQHEVDRTYEFSIDRYPDWEDGEFGDGGSCFFNYDGEYREHKENYVDYMGMQAVCFYDPGTHRGLARMLAIPITHLEDEAWFFFNAYGYGKFQQVRTVSEAFGLSYHKFYGAAFTYDSSYHGKDYLSGEQLYMNHATNFVISSPRVIEHLKAEREQGKEMVFLYDWETDEYTTRTVEVA